MPAHDWYVLVKIRDTSVATGQTELEQYAQEVADSFFTHGPFESTHVVMDNGFGSLVRPHWARDHDITK